MCTRLFLEDAYRKQCESIVTRVEGANLWTDSTVLYPGGGGQPADRGWIRLESGADVGITARRHDAELIHVADEPIQCEAGQQVRVTVDWSRRYALMRTHTAMHILCGVVWRDFRVHVTGGRMEPCVGHLDFEFDRMDRDLVATIEQAINREVEAARPVRVGRLTRAEAAAIPDLIRTKVNLLPEGLTEIRTIEIVGLDLQADGGTHVSNTSAVGPIRIVDYRSKGRTNKRITIQLSEDSAR